MNAPGRDARQWRILVTIELDERGFGFGGTECEGLPLRLEPVRGVPPGVCWFNILIDAQLNAVEYARSARILVGMLHRQVKEGVIGRFHVVDSNQRRLDRSCATVSQTPEGIAVAQDLQHHIDGFDVTLHRLVRDYPDEADFWPEFAQAAIEAERGIIKEHRPAFNEAMVALLRRHEKLVFQDDARGEPSRRRS